MEARRLRDDERAETAATSAGIGRATLVGVVSRDRVRVRTEAGTLRVASLAAAGYLDPEEGDALVVAEGADECFVIGVLGRARLRQPAGSDALAATSDGVVRVGDRFAVQRVKAPQ